MTKPPALGSSPKLWRASHDRHDVAVSGRLVQEPAAGVPRVGHRVRADHRRRAARRPGPSRAVLGFSLRVHAVPDLAPAHQLLLRRRVRVSFVMRIMMMCVSLRSSLSRPKPAARAHRRSRVSAESRSAPRADVNRPQYADARPTNRATRRSPPNPNPNRSPRPRAARGTACSSSSTRSRAAPRTSCGWCSSARSRCSATAHRAGAGPAVLRRLAGVHAALPVEPREPQREHQHHGHDQDEGVLLTVGDDGAGGAHGRLRRAGPAGRRRRAPLLLPRRAAARAGGPRSISTPAAVRTLCVALFGHAGGAGAARATRRGHPRARSGGGRGRRLGSE